VRALGSNSQYLEARDKMEIPFDIANYRKMNKIKPGRTEGTRQLDESKNILLQISMSYWARKRERMGKSHLILKRVYFSFQISGRT